MDIKPIKTEADYDAALREIDRLFDAEENTPEDDRLDVLITLVEAYEEEHYPVPPPDPIEAIKFRLDQQGLTRKDLEPLIGRRGRVAEVLNRKRPLTLPMIRRLNAALKIPADILILDTRRPVARRARRKPTRRRT